MAGEIEFTQLEGTSIAYRVFGEGDRAIVLLHPYYATMRHIRRGMSDVVARLASFSRVILFDRRGFGMSDPVSPDALPTAEDWAEDVIAVMDAASVGTANLVGLMGGGHIAAYCAVAHPERVEGVVFMHMLACQSYRDDYPWGWTEEHREAVMAAPAGGFKQAPSTTKDMGGGIDDESWLRFMRTVASPNLLVALQRQSHDVDVRPQLSAITAPALVLHRAENRAMPLEAGEDLARRLANGRLVAIPGDAQAPIQGDQTSIADEIEEFVTGRRRPADTERVLAAVLFTDIVASVDSKAKTGDQRFKALLTQHNEIVRRQIERHGGTEVNPTGDGFLVTFDAPAKAIRCAQAIVRELEPTGLHIRAGVHAGEIERMGRDITGLTVDIGARVSALAGPDEILVSSTVRDMSIGSGLEFEERGTHELKGVPGEWRIYAIAAIPTPAA